MLTKSSGEKNLQWQKQQIRVKLSTIFKYEVNDTPQTFGSFSSLMEKDIVQFLSCQST